MISQEASPAPEYKDFLSISIMETSKHCWKYGSLILKSKTHSYKSGLGTYTIRKLEYKCVRCSFNICTN